jgi:tRNA-dihydrouridine synthase B
MTPPLNIADLTFDSPFILAPMAGYTDLSFRRICRRMGAALVFTEVTTAEGVRRRSPKTLHYLQSSPEERPVAAHLYASDAAALAAAAEVIDLLDRFALLDINCGCPVPKIARRGAGAALIEEPGKIGKMVRAVREATNLPVTVKTRLGTRRVRPRIKEILTAVEDSGGAAIFIHGRYAEDRHGGEADWEAIAEIKREASIPVIGNGGIENAAAALDKLQTCRVDGVMIGRAAVGNPWIFAEAKSLLEGKPFTPPTPAERFRVIAEHLENLHRSKVAEARVRKRDPAGAGRAACREFYGHLVNYLASTPGLRELRRKIAHTENPETLLRDIAALLQA